MNCEHCNKKIVGQKTVVTTYNPRIEHVFHPECAKRGKKKYVPSVTINLGRWRGI